MKLKKIFGVILCMAAIITGSVYVVSVDGVLKAASNVKSRISDDKLLIDLASGVIGASEKYYYISNIRVENKDVSYKDGIYSVDYVIEMDELLKAENAMQLPQMQGVAEALEIDAKTTTAQLDAALKGKGIDADASKEIVDFVNGIENEYIGKTYPGAVILRANFDSNGNFIKLQTQNFFGEFTDDLSITMPESYSVMKNRGIDQVHSILESE